MPFPILTFQKKVKGLKATIGNTNIVGSNGGPVYPLANSYIALHDGVIKRMNHYLVNGSAGLSFSLGVYDDLAGEPNNLLGTTEVITLASTVLNGFVRKDLITDVPIVQNQIIWLASRFDASYVGRYQTEASAMSRYLIGAGTTLPDPFIQTDTLSRRITLYADVIYYP